MSTRQKRREQDRRIKRARRLAAREGLEISIEDRLPAGVFQLVSYEITPEPLDRPEPGNRLLDKLITDDEREDLLRRLREAPHSVIPDLQRWLERCPDAPLLYNWLTCAYQFTGDSANAGRIIRLNYERNPDYLFAKIGYAQLCMEQGDVDRVREIFDGKFDLKLLYPDRNVFHMTEFIAFFAVMIEYHSRTGNHDTASRLYKVMKQIAPDQDATRRIGRIMEGSVLLNRARALTQRLLRGGKVP